MTKTRKRPKKFVFKILSIALVALSIYLLSGVVSELTTMVSLQKRTEAAQIELDKLRDEKAELIAQKNKLEDDGYVQAYARSNYMFTKEGEQVFFFPTDGE